jgi:hypothetical protein
MTVGISRKRETAAEPFRSSNLFTSIIVVIRRVCLNLAMSASKLQSQKIFERLKTKPANRVRGQMLSPLPALVLMRIDML